MSDKNISSCERTFSGKTIIKNHFLAFVFSLVFYWVLFGFFVGTSPVYRYFDWELELPLPVPNRNTVFRSEGSSQTQWGEYGLTRRDCEKLKSRRKLVLLYGDSYVQALQVDEKFRMQNRAEMHSKARIGFLAIADSGRGIADHAFVSPFYEKLVGRKCVGTIIFVGSKGDFFPNSRGHYSTIRYDQKTREVSFERRRREDLVSSKYELLLDQTKPYFIRSVLRTLSRSLPLKLFRETRNSTDKNVHSYDVDYLTSVLASVRRQIGGRIVIVYAPSVPRLSENGVVFVDSSSFEENLEQACVANDIGFESLQDEFETFFRESKAFPRGFLNAELGKGHLNRDGHEIAAKRIAQLTVDWN